MTAPSDPVTMSEIASRLGVALITVKKWRERHPTFPAPLTGPRPLWEWTDVEAWHAIPRPSGRPTQRSAK